MADEEEAIVAMTEFADRYDMRNDCYIDSLCLVPYCKLDRLGIVKE